MEAKLPVTKITKDITRVGDGLNKIFGSLLEGSFLPAYGEKFWHPVIDIHQSDKDVIVMVELPGISVKECNLSIEENRLTISGERKTKEEFKESNVWYSERIYGSFHRIIDLPVGVITDKAEAKYENGILSVTMPKSEKVRGKKIKIEVK